MYTKKAILRELADYFTTVEDRFHILHKIDAAVFDDNQTIQTFFQTLFQDLKLIFRPKQMGLFAISEKNLLPFSIVVDCQTLLFESSEDIIIPDEVLAGTVIVKTNWLPEQTNNTLFIPIRVAKGMHFVIILQDDLPTVDASQFNIKDNLSFAESLSSQVGILVQHKLSDRIHSLKSELIDEFFKNELKPSQCWNTIVNYIVRFLPDWGPLKIDPAPKTQILTYNKNDRHMILQASRSYEESEGEFIDTIRGAIPLKVDDTICGLVIERNTDVVYVNPTEHVERYKGYLFGSEYPQSELVVAIRYEDEICALMNLEHMGENVFYQYHIDVLLDVANFLGPFVNAVIARERRQRDKEISLLYILTKLLRRMASTYRHKTSGLLLKSRYKINKLEKELKDIGGEPYSHLQELSAYVNEYQERSKTFLSELPRFIHSERIDINRAIDEAKQEFDPDKMASKEKIIFLDERRQLNLDVYASRMLREHIYNLIHNSIDAIRDAKSQGRITEGKIIIRVSRKKVEDAKQKETSPARIYVEIQDNGGGVHPEEFPRIYEFRFTTRRKSGGTGFGLPAAREFMQSIDGDLEVENYFPEGFLVRFYLEEYTPNYHVPGMV